MFYRKDFNVMNDVKKFHPFDASVDGVLKLSDSIWVLIKECKVRDCNLDIGTVIFKPDITDYPNADDLLVIDSIPDNQKDLHFKGKVLAPNNPYIYYEDLVDITFNVTGVDYLKNKLPVYDDYESKLDFKRAIDQISVNLDILRVFAGKENIDRLVCGYIYRNTDLCHSFVIVDDNLDIVRYIHVKDTAGLFLRSTRQTTEFVWLSSSDIYDLCYSSYCLVHKITGVLNSNADITLNNELGATFSFIYDVGLNKSVSNYKSIVSDLEFNNIESAIDDYSHHKSFDSKLVDRHYRFERDCFSDGCKHIDCMYEIAAYNDILSSGIGVEPFNIILSSDFFKNGVAKRLWVGNTGVKIDNDDIDVFVINNVYITYDKTINYDYIYCGKVLLNNGSIKQDVFIEFDDNLKYMYSFVLELTQISLVARHIKNNGYRVDFNKLSYDLGVRPSLIYWVVDKFNHFYKGDKLQPINLTYFDKGGKYLGSNVSEIDSLPSVSDTNGLDNGIDR